MQRPRVLLHCVKHQYMWPLIMGKCIWTAFSPFLAAQLDKLDTGKDFVSQNGMTLPILLWWSYTYPVRLSTKSPFNRHMNQQTVSLVLISTLTHKTLVLTFHSETLLYHLCLNPVRALFCFGVCIPVLYCMYYVYNTTYMYSVRT